MKRLGEQTLYEILEIPQDATLPTIEQAVERIRALYGPGSLATYTLMSPDEAELLATRVREARGISVPQIAERTKVTRHHVENIEAERYAALPAPVYLRGILLSLARELRLDGQKVARAYLERAQAAGYGGGQSR